MTYIRRYDFKRTNRRFGRLLIETRIKWWAGSKAIHLDGPLCTYTANNIIEFILFLEGYVELYLTDVGVSFLAEKLAEGIYMVNPEKSSCHDHPDVSDTECEEKNNDARDSNKAVSVQGGDRGQSANGTENTNDTCNKEKKVRDRFDSIMAITSANAAKKEVLDTENGSPNPPGKPSSGSSAFTALSEGSVVEGDEHSATGTVIPSADHQEATSGRVENANTSLPGQDTENSATSTAILNAEHQGATSAQVSNTSTWLPALEDEGIMRKRAHDTAHDAGDDGPVASKKTRSAYVPPAYLRKLSTR